MNFSRAKPSQPQPPPCFHIHLRIGQVPPREAGNMLMPCGDTFCLHPPTSEPWAATPKGRPGLVELGNAKPSLGFLDITREIQRIVNAQGLLHSPWTRPDRISDQIRSSNLFLMFLCRCVAGQQSAEDLELRDRLALMVERVKDANPALVKTAIMNMRSSTPEITLNAISSMENSHCVFPRPCCFVDTGFLCSQLLPRSLALPAVKRRPITMPQKNTSTLAWKKTLSAFIEFH